MKNIFPMAGQPLTAPAVKHYIRPIEMFPARVALQPSVHVDYVLWGPTVVPSGHSDMVLKRTTLGHIRGYVMHVGESQTSGKSL